jgi:hypothetical protein
MYSILEKYAETLPLATSHNYIPFTYCLHTTNINETVNCFFLAQYSLYFTSEQSNFVVAGFGLPLL